MLQGYVSRQLIWEEIERRIHGLQYDGDYGDGYYAALHGVQDLIESIPEVRAERVENKDCKWIADNEICVNADCPMVADYCPVPDIEGVCRYEDRGHGAQNVIVRCEKCEHHRPDAVLEDQVICLMFKRMMDLDGYCVFGKLEVAEESKQ